MTAIGKDIEKYISEVGTYLFCLKKNRRKVLADIREAVFAFAEEFSVESIEDVYRRFGTPEEIAKAYLSDAEVQNIKKAINIRKVSVAAVAIVLAMLAITFIIVIADSHNANGAYFIDSPIEVITTLPQISN